MPTEYDPANLSLFPHADGILLEWSPTNYVVDGSYLIYRRDEITESYFNPDLDTSLYEVDKNTLKYIDTEVELYKDYEYQVFFKVFL